MSECDNTLKTLCDAHNEPYGGFGPREKLIFQRGCIERIMGLGFTHGVDYEEQFNGDFIPIAGD